MEVSTGNKKRSAILHSAQVLFWKHGFRRVSIDEICREAKTSKMTFYRFFPNKLEVARAVFDMVADEGLVKFRELMEGDTSPSDKMNKMLQLKMEGTNEISNEFISDFYNNPELGLSTYIEEKSKIMWKETLGLFKAGQKDGWIRKDMNVEFMFLLMQKTVPMLTDKEVMKLYNSPHELIKELANMFLYGISPSAV